MALRWFVLLAACGSSPRPEPYTTPPKVTRDGTRAVQPPPPPASGPEAEYAELADKLAARMTAVALTLSPTARECAAVIADFAAFAPRFSGTTATVTRVTDAGRARILNYALEKHATAIDAAARAILASPTLAACRDHPLFVDALDKVWAL